MGQHEYIYKLNIIAGMVLIPLEITADDHHIGEKTGIIYFKEVYETSHTRGKRNISWYPSGSTIIRERIENPDYIPPHNR